MKYMWFSKSYVGDNNVTYLKEIDYWIIRGRKINIYMTRISSVMSMTFRTEELLRHVV